MTAKADPVREADDAARALARQLIAGARTVALGVLDPATGGPFVSRIAIGIGSDGLPVTLVSDLALHSRALAADPRASLLFGNVDGRGDPLNQPRLTVACRALRRDRSGAAGAALRDLWLTRHPKSRLYIDFADFHFVAFEPEKGHLNGGFAKAFALKGVDLRVI